MKRITLIETFVLAVLLFVTHIVGVHGQDQSTSVDVPSTISYQGVVTSASGTAISDGNYEIVVTLYADSEGQEVVWQEKYHTAIAGGLFHLSLGSGRTPLPDVGTMNRPLWVGTEIEGAPELRPLTPLTASPYALNVPDMAITAKKLAEGAVTAEKVDMDYISEVRIDGKKITGKGAVLNLQSGKDINLDYDAVTGSVKIESAHGATGTHKGEKLPTIQGSNDAWGGQGDQLDPGTHNPILPAAGDWLGTSNNVTMEIKTNNQTAMRYQPNGVTTPNLVGGNLANTIVAATSTGSIIAGGGQNAANFNLVHGDYDVVSGGNHNVIGTLLNSYTYSTVSGGDENSIQDDFGTIGGGQSNSVTAQHGTVGGGFSNMVSAPFSTIGGGEGQNANGDYSTASGGRGNSANTNFSTIGGGLSNVVNAPGDYGTVGGGSSNQVNNIAGTVGGGDGNNANGDYGTVSGGQGNNANTNYSTVGGGQNNFVNAPGDFGTVGGGSSNQVNNIAGTVGGGDGNNANGDYGTVSGGQANNVDAIFGTIGGGQNNFVNAPGDFGTVGGGMDNHINAIFGTVGGGITNHINADMGTVAGGQNNHINASAGAIGGGMDNSVDADHGAIGGGQANHIMPLGIAGTIGGGLANQLDAEQGTIGGGMDNHLLPTALFGTIGGGIANHIDTERGTIGGGEANTIVGAAVAGTIGGGQGNVVDADMGTVGGGAGNNVVAAGIFGTVGGGQGNVVDAERATIGGGESNAVTAPYGTIPGGDNLLTTNSYAQTATGFINDPRGAVAIHPVPAALTDDPLFMVGNGDYNGGTLIRSNAFEVSYNGHSVVYDLNGSGGATVFPAPGRSAIRGATYIDNIIYAWADVPDGAGVPVGNTFPPNDDFGVAAVIKAGVGVYDVRINVTDPVTGAVVILNNASITATIVDDFAGTTGCAVITTTQIGVPGPNTFRIRTYNLGGGSCTADDLPFMFKVTGRP